MSTEQVSIVRLILIAAPSGAGKSSFLDRIISEISILEDIITCTTRAMRPGEEHGRPYYFLDEDTFQDKIKQGEFVEWAYVHGKLYGTPRSELERIWSAGKVAIMDIDVQGAETLRMAFPDSVGIFILPPSLQALRERIEKRDKGNTADLDVRLESARRELREAAKFDFQIINDNFEASYAEFRKLIKDMLGLSPKKA